MTGGWAPITSEMGFLETDAAHTARAFAAWQAGLMAPRGITVEVHPISGSLEQVLSALLPMTFPETRRDLFISTRSPWTAYVENGWGGTDAASGMAYMSRTLGCRGLRVVAVPHTYRKGKGRYGAVMLEVYGPHQTAWINTVRAVSAANDGGRWVFHQFGEPFPFEKVEHDNFYLPESAPAWLVEKTGPVVEPYKEYTLAEARAREDL